MGFCTNCGKPVGEGAAFCTNCGKPIAPKTIQPNTAASSQTRPVSPVPPVPPAQSASPAIPAQQARPLQQPTTQGQPTQPTQQVWHTAPVQQAPQTAYVPPVQPAAPVQKEPKNQEPKEDEKKKNVLLPILIAVGALLLAAGIYAAVAFFCHLWPFAGSSNGPEDHATMIPDETELTRRPDRTTEAGKSDAEPAETSPSVTEGPVITEAPTTTEKPTEPPTTTEEPTEAPTEYDPAFLGYWYGDQRTIFILYEDGSVDYFDGGVDGNRLSGTWTLDESTGLFELDLYGGGNRFHLYSELSRGYESTIMYRMAMDWKKSTTKVWYYENFFREAPVNYVEGSDRIQQPYEP